VAGLIIMVGGGSWGCRTKSKNLIGGGADSTGLLRASAAVIILVGGVEVYVRRRHRPIFRPVECIHAG